MRNRKAQRYQDDLQSLIRQDRIVVRTTFFLYADDFGIGCKNIEIKAALKFWSAIERKALGKLS